MNCSFNKMPMIKIMIICNVSIDVPRVPDSTPASQTRNLAAGDVDKHKYVRRLWKFMMIIKKIARCDNLMYCRFNRMQTMAIMMICNISLDVPRVPDSTPASSWAPDSYLDSLVSNHLLQASFCQFILLLFIILVFCRKV
jgi:hypothetical protein